MDIYIDENYWLLYDTMSIDDLYNNFKIVKQEVKRTVVSSSSSGSLNMAFLSSLGSTNEVDTASIQVSAASTSVSTVSSLDNTVNLSDATVYAFLENKPNGSQLVHEYLEKICKKITINGSDTTGYDKTKVECFNCHKIRHFARECRSPRNQESMPRNQDSSRKTVIMEDTSSKSLVAIDVEGFDWSYMADDEVPTNMDLMAFSDSEAGIEPVSAARQSSSRAAAPVSAARPINTTAFKCLTQVSNGLGPQEKLILLYFILGAPQDALKYQGYFDSGCSRHMKGNISCLTDFMEHDGGYVAFEGGAKGGKITSKGNIRTATKDKTSRILKSFITKIENLVEKKVKIIRCDNGTEFKNRVMNELCEAKGIKREYSVARTPQQNRITERRNRTLIEAARTMLSDSKLPTTFWAEAVNTACYVQNRVLVVKPYFKTPYELFKGRSHALSFMRLFGCHVSILNTLDQLGKFDGKLDDGIFIGYSTTSKAFRVYNIRTRKTRSSQDYILMPLWKDTFLFDSSSQASDSHNKDKHGPSQASESDNQERPNVKGSTTSVNIARPVNTATPTYAEYPNDPLMPDLEDAGIFDDAYDNR
nr:ribonuclease H-like domain-containing protein [Tanacetum cinerariifolium]